MRRAGWLLLLAGCAAPPAPAPADGGPDAAFVCTFAMLDPGPPGRAYVSIFRDDPDLGPLRLARIHRVGERIGTWSEGSAPTSRHRTFSPLRNAIVEADWDTGWILKGIEEGEYAWKRRSCREPGAGPCPGPIETIVRIRVREAVYGPPGGPELRHRVPLGNPPVDETCPAHAAK